MLAVVFVSVMAAQAQEAPKTEPKSAPAPAVVEVAPAAAPAADPPTVAPPAPAREKLLVLDVKSGDLSADQVTTLTQLIAARAHRFSQVETASSADLRELATLEAEKQQAGCEGDSCLAELAGAMGARYVLSTRAGKIGSSTVLSVQLYDATKGTVEARDTTEAYAIDDLLAKIAPLVDGVLTQVLGAPQAGAAPLPQAPPKPPPKDGGPDALHLGLQIGGGAAIVVGVVAGALGVVPLALYQQKKGALLDRQRAYDGDVKGLEAAATLRAEAVNMRDLYNNGGRFALIGGVTLVVVGGAALAAGFLLPPLDELGGAGASK